MAARLHYSLHDIAVPLGAFSIGRGIDCQLALDDPLVSRRHALLRVELTGVFIEDLGSRNGVYLNGVRIERAEPVQDGDHIRIGSQDLSFHDSDETHSGSNSDRALRVTRRDLQIEELKEAGIEEPSTQTFAPSGSVGSASSRPNALATIGSVADKALALGRTDEAERILQRALTDILTRAQTTEIDAELADCAAGYAARLASATGRGTWIDYVFQLYAAQGTLMAARLVDELYSAVRKVKHTDKSVMRAYTARLRNIAAGFGPAERFVLQRIEGFERWAP